MRMIGEIGRRAGVVLRDPVYVGILVLGCAGVWFSPGWAPSWWMLVVGAVLEEAVFRGVVQPSLEERFPGRVGSLTWGNVGASVVFGLSHLYAHSPLWALATVGPSLCYGVVWTRHRSVWACAAAHYLHNVFFFYF